MIVEKKKDNYDELQILAGDVRTRRRRTNFWTSSLIAGTAIAGGAYVGDDADGDGIGDWVPLNDPRVFGDPRTIRMGVSFTF